MYEATDRVRRAIRTSDQDYLGHQLAMRAGNSQSAQGSIIPGVNPEELLERLMTADWEPYSHPDVLSGCAAFSAPIDGLLGLVKLAEVPIDTPVMLEDPKNTGKVSAVVRGLPAEAVNFTVIILGPDEDQHGNALNGSDTVWTFHPGAPVRPSLVTAEGRSGHTVTAAEAIEMGFDLAKLA